MADEGIDKAVGQMVNTTPIPAEPTQGFPNRGMNTGVMAGGSAGPVPVMNDDMIFRTVGQYGLRSYSGYIREEFLYELQNRQGVRVYREMSDNSPVIGAMIFAINATMRKVEWRTQAASDSAQAQEMADFADSLRDDMSMTWEDSIVEGLSMLVYGYALQEIVYKRRLGDNPGPDPRRPGKKLPGSKYDDGKIGWRRLPLRGQDTILKWYFDENGEIEGVTQMPWIGSMVDIPIEKMLLFRPTQHKGNPEGRSILRNAYRSYFIVKRLEEQEAILYERLNGIPVVKMPSQIFEQAEAGNATAIAAVANFKRLAVNLRIDEQMGVLMPSDVYAGTDGRLSTVPQYSLELVAPGGKDGGGKADAGPTITRHQTNMLMSVLADFLHLGHGTTGTQALSVSKQDLFFQAVEGYLNSQAAVYNRYGLPRLWALNGFDPKLMPEFVPDLAQRVDLDVLSSFIERLSKSGMALFPNPDLETALLDAAGLPDIQDSDVLASLGEGEGPQAIVGPNAAIATANGLPEPPAAEPGSPRDKFEKIVMASIARRMKKREGRVSIVTKRSQMTESEAAIARAVGARQ